MTRKTEEELVREGFKKIKAWYGGTCSFCGQRYSPDEWIYWKRDPYTTVCCPRCYSGGSGTTSKRRISVMCPKCGESFYVEA